jgi:hypothetical protein
MMNCQSLWDEREWIHQEYAQQTGYRLLPGVW